MAVPINALLLDIPDQFETERLIIRAPRPGDGEVVHRSLVESYKELRPWMLWAQTLQTLDETEQFARRSSAEYLTRQNLPMLLFRKTDGEHVGSSGMHSIDWTVPKFEIGYWLRTSMSNQGYMTEAVNGIVNFAFQTLDAQRLEIRCDARNARSAAVARRAGFTQEGRLRNERVDPDGHLYDTLIFGLIRDEWSRR